MRTPTTYPSRAAEKKAERDRMARKERERELNVARVRRFRSRLRETVNVEEII